MPTFIVKSRKLGALTTTDVEAETREQAVTQTIIDVAEGEEVQIMTVEEAVSEAEPVAEPVAEPAAEPMAEPAVEPAS